MIILTTILFTGINDSRNNGGMAMVLGAISSLKMMIPNAEFLVLSDDLESDTKRYKSHDLTTIRRITHGNNFKISSRWFRIIVMASYLSLIHISEPTRPY